MSILGLTSVIMLTWQSMFSFVSHNQPKKKDQLALTGDQKWHFLVDQRGKSGIFSVSFGVVKSLGLIKIQGSVWVFFATWMMTLPVVASMAEMA